MQTVKEYLAKIGKKGGESRAKNHTKTELREWGLMGGRPPKKTLARGTETETQNTPEKTDK